MRPGGRQQLLVIAAQDEADAILLDRQTGLPAGGLDGVHDLASQALAAQPFVVQRQLQGHGVDPLALQLVAVERLHRELEVVGPELMLAAVHGDADRPFLAQGVSHVRGVDRRGHRSRDLGHLLAVPRSSAARKLGLTS